MSETQSFVLLFSSDLMLISSVSGAASAAGRLFASVSRVSDLIAKSPNESTLLCLDLSAAEGDPNEIALVVGCDVLAHGVAFGPHVHTAKLDLARLAGFGHVMSRGQFVAKLLSIVSAGDQV